MMTSTHSTATLECTCRVISMLSHTCDRHVTTADTLWQSDEGRAKVAHTLVRIVPVEPLALAEVPQHGHPVLAPTGAQGAIRRHRHCVDVPRVPQQVLPQLAVGQVPHLHHLHSEHAQPAATSTAQRGLRRCAGPGGQRPKPSPWIHKQVPNLGTAGWHGNMARHVIARGNQHSKTVACIRAQAASVEGIRLDKAECGQKN